MRRDEPPGSGLPPSARGPGLSTRETVNCRSVTSPGLIDAPAPTHPVLASQVSVFYPSIKKMICLSIRRGHNCARTRISDAAVLVRPSTGVASPNQQEHNAVYRESENHGLSQNFWGVVAAGLFVASNAVAGTELTVYTAVEAEDLKRYAETFNQDHPDIKINWVRDSTGIVTAKLLAEKNNPQADVVCGLAGTSLLLLKAEGMLEPYAPTVSATVSRRRQAWLRRCTPRVNRPWRMRTTAEV